MGTDSGEVQIWDPERAGLTPLRTMAGHDGRVGCLSWSSHILASGSRDRSILLRDVRAPEPFVAKLSGHRSEVCGLQWGAGDREVASGGNDNVVNIWNVSSTDRPVHQFTEASVWGVRVLTEVCGRQAWRIHGGDLGRSLVLALTPRVGPICARGADSSGRRAPLGLGRT